MQYNRDNTVYMQYNRDNTEYKQYNRDNTEYEAYIQNNIHQDSKIRLWRKHTKNDKKMYIRNFLIVYYSLICVYIYTYK
jgi:hypothetical protein